MRRFLVLVPLIVGLALSLGPPLAPMSQSQSPLTPCGECAYSTEEDFITQGPTPPDGNPIISDGDLLSCSGAVCLRNAQLVRQFDVTQDMGLDAVDVLDVERTLVAFSTELNSPHGNFTHGDLLTTSGIVIPNTALLRLFQVAGDRGLDAVHFVGKIEDILRFLEAIANVSRDEWLADPGKLVSTLQEYEVDIWFSIEGTEQRASVMPIYDGDLLSARNGNIVVSNGGLLPVGVPAGLLTRGVDFGLDAVTADRSGSRQSIRFSTEILYRGKLAFNDGDILGFNNGILKSSRDLYAPLEPKADFLGTDALYIKLEKPAAQWDNYLPHVLRSFVQRIRALVRTRR